MLIELMAYYVTQCQTKNWSEKSIQKMSEVATPGSVPRAHVVIADNYEMGCLLYQSTFSLEGNDPLYLTAYCVFHCLDEYVEDRIRLKSKLNV